MYCPNSESTGFVHRMWGGVGCGGWVVDQKINKNKRERKTTLSCSFYMGYKFIKDKFPPPFRLLTAFKRVRISAGKSAFDFPLPGSSDQPDCNRISQSNGELYNNPPSKDMAASHLGRQCESRVSRAEWPIMPCRQIT